MALSAPSQESLPLEIRFLGGLEEIGMNCTSISCGDVHLLIDAGIGFPDAAYFPGASLMHPAFDRLQDKPPTALLLTHGHEDHIGAVSYLLQHFDLPVFGTPFTLGLVKAKLQEHNLRPVFHLVQPGKPVEIGPFLIDWIQVNHSIPGSCALSIQTPQGHLVHSGDLKFDLQAPDHQGGASLSRFGALGDAGVDLLLCESTQIYSKQPTESEQSLYPSLLKIIQEAQGRVFFVLFASHVERIKMAIEIARKTGRRIVTSGSSIERNLLLARDLGYLRLKDDELVDVSSVSKIPHERLLILATGSQAEPAAAMTRISRGEHPFFQLTPEDTVIWSASFIPSNIAPISFQINRIMLQGVRVFHSPLHHVHASGHASRSELQLLHKLLRPRFLVPIHGEYRFLEEHRRLALASGLSDDQIFVCQNGDALRWNEDGLARSTSYPADRVYRFHPKAPPLSLDDLKDRRLLAKNGVLSISLVLSSQGELLAPIQIEASGIPCQPRDLLHLWPDHIKQLLADLPPHLRAHADHITHAIKRLFRSLFKSIDLVPTILPFLHILPASVPKDTSASRNS